MVFIGFNIGALTVKVAALRGDVLTPKVVAHQGRPLEVLRDLQAESEFADGNYFGVSGRLGHVSEVAAIQRALQEVPGNFDAIASLGGESFLVYLVNGGRITNVLSHNKCAAGSGEFFVQQIGRMGLTLDEAIQRSFDGKVVPLASRCSVHCKSDITHKLNRSEATVEDILHTLHDCMANKVVALLEKGQCELREVLVIGGVTRNDAMLAALRTKLPATRFVVLQESPWFEAWGTALLTRDEPIYRKPNISKQATLSRLAPLQVCGEQVQVIPTPPLQAPPEGTMILGVDAGSTTTKAVLIDPATRAVVASHYARTNGEPIAATRQCLYALVDLVGNRCVDLVGTTGSARELAGAYLGTALAQAIASGQPAVLLAGHSYSAFSPEASQSVGKKLSSMGIAAIPSDCLAPAGEGPMAWHFANEILNAVAIAKQHPNLFLLCVSNFSCTIDAFTQSLLASEMGATPYLILEIDAHTADAGIQTRIEAFLDIVRSYHQAGAACSEPFVPCRLAAHGQVIRSNGESLAITDSRVKICFPSFSDFHSQSIAMAARWLGLHTGDLVPLERRQLERGLQYTSGRECLPLPISIGQLLQVNESRRPDEVAGFFMLRGGAPCVVDCYMGYFDRFIAEQRMADVFLMNPQPENDYCGFSPGVLARHLTPAILAADILVEIEQVLRVVGAKDGVEKLRALWERFVAESDSIEHFHAGLAAFVTQVAALPRTRDPMNCPRVVVTGDFFTRFNPFFMEGVPERYAERGIILKPVDLSDLILYSSYHGVAEAARAWGMKPGGPATVKACTRVFQPDGRQYLSQWLSFQSERRNETNYRRIFQKTGLLVAGPNDTGAMYEKAAEQISPEIFGEAIPTVGKGLEAATEGYNGIIVIGPFNCLPFRISEAILKPICIQRGMPILTYESDGYTVAPSFLRQVEVHIQQVLEHASRSRESRPAGMVARLTSAINRWGEELIHRNGAA